MEGCPFCDGGLAPRPGSPVPPPPHLLQPQGCDFCVEVTGSATEQTDAASLLHPRSNPSSWMRQRPSSNSSDSHAPTTRLPCFVLVSAELGRTGTAARPRQDCVQAQLCRAKPCELVWLWKWLWVAVFQLPAFMQDGKPHTHIPSVFSRERWPCNSSLTGACKEKFVESSKESLLSFGVKERAFLPVLFLPTCHGGVRISCWELRQPFCEHEVPSFRTKPTY